jgi:hypothetical protein
MATEEAKRGEDQIQALLVSVQMQREIGISPYAMKAKQTYSYTFGSTLIPIPAGSAAPKGEERGAGKEGTEGALKGGES